MLGSVNGWFVTFVSIQCVVPILSGQGIKGFADGTVMLSRTFDNNLPIDPAQHPRNYTKEKVGKATAHSPFTILQEFAAETHPKPDESSPQKSHSFPLMSI